MKNRKIEKEVENVKRAVKRESKNVIFNAAFAILTIIAVILTYKNIPLASACVFLISLVGLIKWKSPITLAVFIFTGLFGTISEMFAINYGVWQYSTINFYNIPFWLFFVWGNAGMFVYQTALEFKKLGVEK